jgi:signal transduction histidine kinase
MVAMGVVWQVWFMHSTDMGKVLVSEGEGDSLDLGHLVPVCKNSRSRGRAAFTARDGRKKSSRSKDAAVDLPEPTGGRRRKERLAQANKMVKLGAMVSGVAHEINNPNSFIVLSASTLADILNDMLPVLDEHCRASGDFTVGGLSYPEIRREIPKLLAAIMDGSDHIREIVADLKRFVRMEPVVMSEHLDVNEVVRSAVTLMAHVIRKTTDRFTIIYAGGLPTIRGSFQKIEQVVINLLSNSCEALTGREQGITVTVRHLGSEQCISIQVADEGVGMTNELIGRIADPFFSTKRDCGGTGLGLMVSREIVREHGGQLRFSSVPGKGTTAEVRLPMKEGTL